MPQLDAWDVGDPLELQGALGVDQQHAEGLHPIVELRVDEAFHRRARGDEDGHLVRRSGVPCGCWRRRRR